MGLHHLRSESIELQIDHKGLPPIPLRSILLTLFLTLLVGVVTALAWQGLAPKLSDGWYLRFDWWWRIVVYFMIFVGPAALISLFAISSAASSFHYVKTVRCSERERAMVIVDATLFGLRTTTTRLDLEQIREITIYIGAEHTGPLQIEMAVSAAYNDAHFELAIEHVDRRDEAIDVLFTMARFCHLDHYRVDHNDADQLVIHAIAAAQKGSEPIPEAKGVARYEIDQLAAPTEAPEVEVGAFHCEQFRDYPIALDVWRSQQLVRFHRPPFKLVATILLGCLFAAGFGAVGYMVAAEMEDVSRLTWAAIGAVIGFVVGAAYFRVANPEYEVAMDRSTNQLRWRTGWWRRSMPLGKIRSVLLRGNEQDVHRKNDQHYTVYRCRLYLTLDNGKQVFLTENKDWGRSADPQRRALEPLAAALAKEAGVRWNWTGYDKPPVSKFFDSLWQIIILLGLVALMSFFAWGTWMQGRREAEWQAITKQLESEGATVTRGGIEIGSVHIFGDGLLVEVNDPQFDDKALNALTEKLAPIPLYGLDLSDTQVTDKGLQGLVGNLDLFLIDLSGTQVTIAAPELLAKTNLRSIDLRDTPVRLEHLRPFSQFYALNVLYLDGRDTLSDREMTNLMSIPQLDAIWVQDEETTAQVLSQLAERTGRPLQTAGEIRFSLD